MSSAEALTCEMARNEKRAVNKYLNIKGLTLNEILSDMKVVLGDDAPLYATIYRWIPEFQRGRKLTEDAHRSGRLWRHAEKQWRSEWGAGGAGRTGRHLPGAANGRNLEKNHGKIQTERGHRASITRKRGITVPSPPD